MQVKSFLKEEHPYYYSKTEKGWNRENRVINPDAEGMKMWHNGYCQSSAVYYRLEETHEPSPEELAVLRAERRNKAKRYAENRKARKEAEIREDEAWKWEMKIGEIEGKSRNMMINMLRFIVSNSSPMPVVIPSKTVIFDTETTGMCPGTDEILQISIMDADENVLLNTYIKPYLMNEWSEAQGTHGITPEMVENAPYLHEVILDIKAIFDVAEFIVGYNIGFDRGFLSFAGIDLSKKQQIDVMEDFAPLYGEWSNYYQSFKWQKLSTCASYFDFEFKAHDSLEDVKATLHCYKKIISLKESGEYDRIVNQNYENEMEYM